MTATRRLLRYGLENKLDLLFGEAGFTTDTQIFYVGIGSTEFAGIPTSETTGIFEYDPNLKLKVGLVNSNIDNCAIGASTPSQGIFTNAKLKFTGDSAASNNPILVWASSEVAHDFNLTSIDADVYGFTQRVDQNFGGLRIVGLGEQQTGLELAAYLDILQIENTQASNSRAVVEFTANATSSGDPAALTGDANAFGFFRSTASGKESVGFLTADGDLYLDGSTSITLFDDYDDVQLVGGMGVIMRDDDALTANFKNMIDYARPVLEQYNIISIDSGGKVYLNMKRAMLLLMDALRQLGDRVNKLENS